MMAANFKKTVLIVDDDPILVELFDEILSESFNTSTASNIPDAMYLMTNTTVDALVCDYHIGTEKADVLIDWIALKTPELIPNVILLSGTNNMHFNHREKIASVMLKPVDFNTLMQSVSSLFGQPQG